MALSTTDKKILRILQANGHLPNAALADQIDDSDTLLKWGHHLSAFLESLSIRPARIVTSRCQAMLSTMPPSTRSVAPVVALACGEAA